MQINKAGDQIASKVDSDSWIDLYNFIVNESNSKEVNIEYLLIIFCSEYKFDIKSVEKINKGPYMDLMDNKITIDEWNKFQYVLPQVEACYAWDRCRRIRNALD